MSGTVELESCLRVAGVDPAAVFAPLAEMQTLADHRLEPGGTRVQRDVYVDTPERALGQQHFGLRIRARAGAAEVVTLKGPPVASGTASTTRLEIEGPREARTLADIVAALGETGVEVTLEPDTELLGLEVVQDRTTERTIRNVRDTVNTLVAEIVLDIVRYDIGERQLRHYEIEIESKGPGTPSLIEALTTALLEQAGDRLRPWPLAKLVTGLAMEALDARGELDDTLNDEGQPTEALYEAIERAAAD